MTSLDSFHKKTKTGQYLSYNTISQEFYRQKHKKKKNTISIGNFDEEADYNLADLIEKKKNRQENHSVTLISNRGRFTSCTGTKSASGRLERGK